MSQNDGNVHHTYDILGNESNAIPTITGFSQF